MAMNIPAAVVLGAGAQGAIASAFDAVVPVVPTGGMELARAALGNFSNGALAGMLVGSGVARSSTEYKSAYQAVRRLRNSVEGTGHQARGLGKKFAERLAGSSRLRDALKGKLGFPSGGVHVTGHVHLIYGGRSEGTRRIDMTLTSGQLDRIRERIAEGADPFAAIFNTVVGAYMEDGSTSAEAYTDTFEAGEGTDLTFTT